MKPLVEIFNELKINGNIDLSSLSNLSLPLSVNSKRKKLILNNHLHFLLLRFINSFDYGKVSVVVIAWLVVVVQALAKISRKQSEKYITVEIHQRCF